MTPRLIAISDRRVASAEVTLERFFELGRLAQPGSVIFQLRDLELSTRERMSFGISMARMVRDVSQLFVVNERVDLGVLLGADGVHLGERSIETRDARSFLGPGAFISRACHEPDFVGHLAAEAVLLSPVAEPRKGRPALGIEGLRRARASIAENAGRTLLYALGGVSVRHAAEYRTSGADGVAVVGAVLRGEGPELVRVLGIERPT